MQRAASDAEGAETSATIRRRVRGLLMRRGLEARDTSSVAADPLVEESPVLAGIVSASVQGRVAWAHAQELGDAASDRHSTFQSGAVAGFHGGSLCALCQRL